MVILTIFMTSYLNIFGNFINKILTFLVLPSIFNYAVLTIDVLNSLRICIGVFWKVANYADAYWFLYSNKKILHENLVQVGSRS